MKQDKQENNDVLKSVEQDALDSPGEYFYISEELVAQLKKFEGQSFLIGGAGCAQFSDCDEA